LTAYSFYTANSAVSGAALYAIGSSVAMRNVTFLANTLTVAAQPITNGGGAFALIQVLFCPCAIRA